MIELYMESFAYAAAALLLNATVVGQDVFICNKRDSTASISGASF